MPALAYLKIEEPKIDGESDEKDHKGWIAVDEISYLIKWEENVRAAEAAGRLNGEPSHPGLIVTKPIDKSSPMLRQKCASGERLGRITLNVVNLAGSGVVAHEIILAPAFISRIEVLTTGGQPKEQVEFRYGTVKWVHTSQNKMGQKDATSEGSWDLRQHQPL